jgi:hypothetical protein
MEDNINARPERPNLLAAEISYGLYNLTGWEGTFFNYWKSHVGSGEQWVLSWYGNVETRELKERIPAYDLTYLLDKLPKTIEHEGNEYFLTIGGSTQDNGWQLDYRDTDDGQYHAEEAETLAECAGLMAGHLVSNGLLQGKEA